MNPLTGARRRFERSFARIPTWASMIYLNNYYSVADALIASALVPGRITNNDYHDCVYRTYTGKLWTLPLSGEATPKCMNFPICAISLSSSASGYTRLAALLLTISLPFSVASCQNGTPFPCFLCQRGIHGVGKHNCQGTTVHWWYQLTRCFLCVTSSAVYGLVCSWETYM